MFVLYDYNLCFIGSPYYNASYYIYKFVWPYYIVIHLTLYHRSVNFWILSISIILLLNKCLRLDNAACSHFGEVICCI